METITYFSVASIEQDSNKNLEPGDIVTLNPNVQDIETYVVESILDQNVVLLGIDLTEAKDDVFIKRVIVNPCSITHIGDAYINIGGLLHKIKQKVLNHQTDNINISHLY